MHERAGTRALPSDLIDLDALLSAYDQIEPDPTIVAQRVTFGTSGHRGSSFDAAFNEAHIVAMTAAIIDYRQHQGITGPLFLGRDTHGLSGPAWVTALEVLAGADVDVMIDSRQGYTPTPAISHAILATPRSDGIVITPSHNPPRDGGFKYNPPHGGPADTETTQWIAARANQILTEGWRDVARVSEDQALRAPTTHRYDFLGTYVDQLDQVIDVDAIRAASVRIGADPMGGAAVDYWSAIADRHRLDLTVVNSAVDPRWSFMTLDWDGKIRMDCSSAHAMAGLREIMAGDSAPYDIATGNDADADRHGIVTRDGSLMNPNHYLAAAIWYLYGGAREQWPADAAIGKTLVSSALIDRVGARLGRQVVEVPVGFKWFVDGLQRSTIAFGGEESAGASFLRRDGSVWSTDKDGIIAALLAAEILAVTGSSPSQVHEEITAELGTSHYARVDATADAAQRAALGALSPDVVTATELAGHPITGVLTVAPGNNEPIGGLKVTTDQAWFAARPSGTEDVYKIYAESFVSPAHLEEVQRAATELVDGALGS